MRTLGKKLSCNYVAEARVSFNSLHDLGLRSWLEEFRGALRCNSWLHEKCPQLLDSAMQPRSLVRRLRFSSPPARVFFRCVPGMPRGGMPKLANPINCRSLGAEGTANGNSNSQLTLSQAEASPDHPWSILLEAHQSTPHSDIARLLLSSADQNCVWH